MVSEQTITTVGTVDLSSALQVAIEAQKHTFDGAQRKWLDRNDIVTPISTMWQNMQGGSSMLGTCHISSSRSRPASLAVALGEGIPNIRSKEVCRQPLGRLLVSILNVHVFPHPSSVPTNCCSHVTRMLLVPYIVHPFPSGLA